jgi:hypothetical protein
MEFEMTRKYCGAGGIISEFGLKENRAAEIGLFIKLGN